MKKSTFLIGMLAMGSFAFGQSQRMVLAEEFTQASCGPCAAQNPTYNSLLSANTNKVVSIKYQTNWPGVDPMNTQTQTDVGPRVTYYAVSGVPDSPMDGVEQTGGSYTGAPANYTQAAIDNEYAVPAPFTINLTHTFSSDYDSVFITCVITASQAYTPTGVLKAHIAMVEKTINFTTAPGTNGETVFYNVMRKMYPSAAGTTLPTAWTSGQTQTITFARPVPAYIYSKAQIAIVAFIQDDGNKSVQQAAINDPLPIPIDMGTTAISGVPLYQCATSFSPTVTIKNFGANTLTSCDVNYKIDAGAVTTIPWTGSLVSGATTTVSIGAITATAGGHTFTSYTSNPNGGTDNDAANNQKSQSFAIIGAGASAPLTEGYQATAFPPSGWFLNNPDGGPTWTRKTGAGGFGTSSACAKIDFYSSPGGEVDEMYAKNVNFSGISSAELKFNVAYAQYNATYVDQLDVEVSTDCGATWTNVYSKNAGTLATNGGAFVTSAYTPTAAQWRAETVNLNAYAGQPSVMVRFVATSGFGNNAYVDDINLWNPLTASIIEASSNNSVNVFPNPMTNNATVNFNLAASANVNVVLVNALGQEVINTNLGMLNAGEQQYLLNAESLSNGLYFLNLQVGKEKITKKVSINK